MFRLTAEQLKELDKVKVQPKEAKADGPTIQLAVNKNGKPYLVIHGCVFYSHQAKALLACIGDKNVTKAQLELFLERMVKFKEHAKSGVSHV